MIYPYSFLYSLSTDEYWFLGKIHYTLKYEFLLGFYTTSRAYTVKSTTSHTSVYRTHTIYSSTWINVCAVCCWKSCRTMFWCCETWTTSRWRHHSLHCIDHSLCYSPWMSGAICIAVNTAIIIVYVLIRFLAVAFNEIATCWKPEIFGNQLLYLS